MKQCASAVALVLAVACSSLAHLFLLKMLSCHLNNRHPSWGGRCPARAASCACPTATERATDARIYVPIGHGVAPTTRTATRSMSRGRSVTGVGGCSSGHDELPLSSGHARHTAQQRWPPAKVEGAASPAAGGGDGGSSSGQSCPRRRTRRGRSFHCGRQWFCRPTRGGSWSGACQGRPRPWPTGGGG